MKKIYYYKTKQGEGYLKTFCKQNKNDLIEITEAQWLEHKNAINNPQPSAAQLKKREISQLLAFLKSTDWIICKIAEETDADEIAALRTKYASVIAERKAARARINELEGE